MNCEEHDPLAVNRKHRAILSSFSLYFHSLPDRQAIGFPCCSSGKGRRSKVKTPVSADGETVMRESIFDTMLSGPRPVATVLIVRPDAVRRNFSAVLRRVVQEGFHVVGLRLEALSESSVKQLSLSDVSDTLESRFVFPANRPSENMLPWY